MSLRERLASGEVTVTAEVGPPRGADPAAVRRDVEPLRGWVDAVNIPDSPSAHARMSSWGGSLLALAAGVEPVMQMTCRDRNRIALQSDLLSASALGIPNVLIMTGDHPRYGDHPDAKPVFDLDSVQLLWTARTMREEARLLSGRPLRPPPTWLLGAVENPFAPPTAFRAARLGKKVAAGAEFAQTQFVFDVPAFARWMAQVRDLGIDRRCAILAGVGPVRSLRALEYMRSHVPGIHIPDEVVRRLRGVPAGQVAQEGLRMCADIIGQVLAVPGVRGVHVMAPGSGEGIPGILELAGLGRRGGAGPARAGGEDSQSRAGLGDSQSRAGGEDSPGRAGRRGGAGAGRAGGVSGEDSPGGAPVPARGGGSLPGCGDTSGGEASRGAH